MKTPTIHLNGTHGERLIEEVEEARRHLLRSLQALEALTVNARDYYPQGDGAFEVARAEHQARIAKVREVYVEMGEYHEAILKDDDEWIAARRKRS